MTAENGEPAMSTLPGRWALSMRTPVGTIAAEMTFAADGAELTGTARGASETVRLSHLRSSPTDDGEHVSWTQSITRPMRLDLDFDVTVVGDEMHGFSRAGRLPRSTVTGRRLVD